MLKVQRARRRFLNYLILTLAGSILAIPAHAEDITGKPRIIDGDTIEKAGDRIAPAFFAMPPPVGGDPSGQAPALIPENGPTWLYRDCPTAHQRNKGLAENF